MIDVDQTDTDHYPVKIEPNELHPELVSICGFNPWLQHDSSGRVHMTSSHLGQMLVVDGATERKQQTGIEREYGKYTFNVKMPVDGEIIDIIERYRSTLGQDSISENPQTIVVYEDINTKELGIINLVRYCSNHQYFGFQYMTKSGCEKIHIGAMIPKDTVFLDSPNITDDGGYKYGIELNMALMTHPAASEDGVLICRDVLPKLSFKTYENRVVEWGNKKFALNLYGDVNNYKSFPDIGERIRDDGILMALRGYEPDILSPIDQSIKDTMDVDLLFDNTVYAGGPGGRIVDIKIHHDLAKTNCADVHMDKQAQKYDYARRQFYQKIVTLWRKFHKERGESLQITPEFQRLIVEALSVTSEGGNQKVSKLYRKAPLDDYRVEFVIEYDIKPGIGFKLTDIHGGKGVICQIASPEEMPVDSEGNRADIVMDPNSTVSRMNLGRVYEMYINAASRDTHKMICRNLDIAPFTKSTKAFNLLNKRSAEDIKNAFELLLGYYKIVSPKMFHWCQTGAIEETPVEYLSTVIEKGIYLYLPTDNPPESMDMVKQIESGIYKPVYGPVTYVGNSGQRVITKNSVRVSSMYFILLEKIGDDWAAVSSCKLSHFGVLSQLTKSDKFSKPSRNQAVRGAGEAEVRIFSSYVGEKFTAEMMDRNNSPKTHKHMVKNIISAQHPTNIDNLVDRSVIPYGGSKPLALVTHLATVGGWSFKYKPYKPNW